MTLLLILMDHQTYMVHRNELPAERLAAEIGRGDWSNIPWESQWINELPRQVIAQDGLVIVSVGRPGQTIAEDAPALTPIQFSARQVEILDCLMKGLTLKEISTRLKIARRTLEKQMNQIKQKLEARTIPQTVGRAVALGYWKSGSER